MLKSAPPVPAPQPCQGGSETTADPVPRATPNALPTVSRTALAATAAVVVGLTWVAIDLFGVHVAFSRRALEMSADLAWPDWRWRAAWLAPAIGALATGLRWRRFGGDSLWIGRVLSLSALTGCLAGLRLLSLWSPMGRGVPVLALLWSPHATWSLGLVWVALLSRGRATESRPSPGGRIGREALIVGALALVAYSVLCLYTCQMTMLHGDEAHYVAVTQSLLRDGDMDLAGDLTSERIVEYHVVAFEAHRAPASPAGRTYSRHPIGLSALMTGPYVAGQWLWSNPRLACALAMALIAATCLGLAHLWLRRLGTPQYAAIAAVVIAGSTAPLALYSGQLYPELPGLAIALAILAALAHWQTPGGSRRALGRFEPALLAALTAAAGLLPFLHPRYAPLAGALAAAVALQAAMGARRRPRLIAVGLTALAAAAAHLAFNLHFSGDWLGPLRPGSAWEEDALSLAIWARSLPGHWVHGSTGLLNSSPVYLLALAGLARLAWYRDRRFAVAAGLYVCTAAVNGLHPDWTFGFCMPGRYLITAMPTLVLGLAAIMPRLWRSSAACFAAAMALTISWDTVLAWLTVPEKAYAGTHLGLRALAAWYPFETHFTEAVETPPDAALLVFWLTAGASVALLGVGLPRGDRILGRHRGAVAAAGLVAGLVLLPGAWGHSTPSRSGYAAAVPPGMPVLRADETVEPRAIAHRIALRYKGSGYRDDSGRTAALGSEGAARVAAYFLPIQLPGVYGLRLDGTSSLDESPSAPNRVVVVHRRALPAVQDWEMRRQKPLRPDREGRLSFDYMVTRPELGYLHYFYAGAGDLRLGATELYCHYTAPALSPSWQASLTPEPLPGADARLAARAMAQLAPGYYRARFELAGWALGALVERKPSPVVMACQVWPEGTPTARIDAAAERWLAQDRRLDKLMASAASQWPQVELLAAPWWVDVPLAGPREYQFEFVVRRPSQVVLLARYDGSADLNLQRIDVRRMTMAAAPLKPAGLRTP